MNIANFLRPFGKLGIGISASAFQYEPCLLHCKSPLESKVSSIYFSQWIQQLTILSRLMECLTEHVSKIS